VFEKPMRRPRKKEKVEWGARDSVSGREAQKGLVTATSL